MAPCTSPSINPAAAKRGPCIDHFGIEVDDVENCIAEVGKYGCEVLSERGRRLSSARRTDYRRSDPIGQNPASASATKLFSPRRSQRGYAATKKDRNISRKDTKVQR